jgi:outer membrane immunogenic protein
MKRLALAVIASAAFVGSASAADIAATNFKALPPPVPVMTWTGCYVGGGGGYGLWNQENTFFQDPPSVPGRTMVESTHTDGGRGFLGTVSGGCDYQLLGSIVVGAFGDYDFTSLKGLSGLGTGVANEKMSSQWSVGGRAGWLVTPTVLTYFVGGYTQATFDRMDFLTSFQGVIGSPAGVSIDKRNYNGWFLGAGEEFALGFLPGLFWKTEYRFSQFDMKTNSLLVNNLPIAASVDSQKWVQTVRTELVYRFNFGSIPLTAKY